MNDKKSIIALVMPSLDPGGSERVISELANYFSQYNEIVVHLILFGKNPQIFYQINNNINIHKINSGFNNKFILIESLKRLRFIRKKINQINPNTILSFGTRWNNFVLLSLCFKKYSIFISDRGSPVRRYKFSTELLKSILYPKARGIIVQTKKAYEITLKRFPNANIKIIGNPINNLIYNNICEREDIILTVGRLISSKHHDRLIRIFSKLNASGWKLVIVGGDALKENNYEKLATLIKQSGLSSNIVLTGPQKDVISYYYKSKIFAFTSSVEGFPNVIIEAMAAGLPVVSYDCVAGPSEIITDGENGFLIPLFDDELFQKRLQQLIDDEELRQKMAAKAPASVEKFSIGKIGQQYLDFILS